MFACYSGSATIKHPLAANVAPPSAKATDERACSTGAADEGEIVTVGSVVVANMDKCQAAADGSAEESTGSCSVKLGPGPLALNTPSSTGVLTVYAPPGILWT